MWRITEEINTERKRYRNRIFRLYHHYGSNTGTIGRYTEISGDPHLSVDGVLHHGGHATFTQDVALPVNREEEETIVLYFIHRALQPQRKVMNTCPSPYLSRYLNIRLGGKYTPMRELYR